MILRGCAWMSQADLLVLAVRVPECVVAVCLPRASQACRPRADWSQAPAYHHFGGIGIGTMRGMPAVTPSSFRGHSRCDNFEVCVFSQCRLPPLPALSIKGPGAVKRCTGSDVALDHRDLRRSRR